MKLLLKDVLDEIKPAPGEEMEVKKKVDDFISRLNRNLKEAKAVLGGSGAKGTWLRHTHDADVFVQFNYRKYKDRSDELSDILEKVLKKTFGKVSRLHGSRDYFQIKKGKFVFEVVPILKITRSENAVNITDVSPLHADWVIKHKKYADDIRLTKQFMKAGNVYGAESYIKGFSGYMAEVLTIHYKGFMKLVRAAAKWDEKTILDPEKYYKNKNDVLFNINKSKQQGPMILIDPVQKDRNVAAALGEDRYWKFIVDCREFLEDPDKMFFEIRDISIDAVRKPFGKYKKSILLKVGALKGKEDVVGSKLLKVFEYLRKCLEENSFKCMGNWQWDKGKEAYIWFHVEDKKLPEYVEMKGPPVKIKHGVEAFKKKHGKTFVKKGRVYAKDKRKYREAEKLVKKLIKGEYVKERVNSIRLL